LNMCWWRSRKRDPMLPRILYHRTHRVQCSMLLRWCACSRVLRCTGRSRSWKSRIWLRPCCNADYFQTRSTQVDCNTLPPPLPPHHPNPCSLLLPHTPFGSKLVFGCSRPRTFCRPLLLHTQIHRAPSSGKNHHHTSNSKSTPSYSCMWHYHTYMPLH
jgi:hypothetical protein